MENTNQTTTAALHPFLDGRLWGYLDNAGNIAITPTFQMAKDFAENRAAVRRGDNTGYINTDGSWACVLPDGAFPVGTFNDERAWFQLDGRYGAVDLNGKIVIPPTYGGARDFSEGLAAVMSRHRSTNDNSEEHAQNFLDRAGMIVDPTHHTHKWGYIDRGGEVVIPLQYAYAGDFGNGLAPVRRPRQWYHEYLDHAGQVVFTLKSLPLADGNYVSSAHSVSGLRALIRIDGDGPDVPFVIFLDSSGHQVGNHKFDGARPYREGLAAVVIDNRVGYVDVAGKVVISAKFHEGGDFHEGLCRVRVGDIWQYINPKGVVVARSDNEKTWNDAEDFYIGLERV